ncbi:MAG TPA: hypothetical protein PKM63_13360 [Panacibacter sp.]|nr:hypothetical protein [Panacibacter sp.]HNP45271.1 hypothetical protein [Panacibacter sp.]
MKRNFNAGKIGMMIIFGFAAVVVLGFVIMALWNNILVPVLHVTLINYWQALGLFLLSKLLFGGMGGGGWKRGHRGGPGWGRQEMSEKWQSMSPEERAQLKEQWKNRCRNWKRNPDEETTGQTTATPNQ